MEPTYVFVHGTHSNSFVWGPMQRELALFGHRTLAVDLPGHGYGAEFPASYHPPQDLAALATEPSALAGSKFADAVDHVVDVVRKAAKHGPVILVGHSRGGLTLTGVGNAIPDLIDHIVYISAWCCVDRTAQGYVGTPEHSTTVLYRTARLVVGNPARLGALRFNWRTADTELLAALKLSMLHDCTDHEFFAYLNTLEPDDSLDFGGEEDRTQADTWGRIPRTYIRLIDDTSMPVALQDRFIKEADLLTPDNQFDVHSLASSHAKFLIYPQRAAAILASLAVRL